MTPSNSSRPEPAADRSALEETERRLGSDGVVINEDTEYLNDDRPASTPMIIAGLACPEWRIEIDYVAGMIFRPRGDWGRVTTRNSG